MTTTCYEFIPLIEPKEIKEILVTNIVFYNKKYNSEIVAYAFMPEHIHLMIYFKDSNRLIDYMRDFKRFISREILQYWKRTKPELLEKLIHHSNGQNHKVWMDRFDDLHLYSPKVCYTKLNYINNNPVKRGLCDRTEDYAYSSGAFYKGIVDPKIPLTHLRDLL